ncbi:hypothetical protein [Streptomyces sp. Z26]|uniref:hypothetical protein n=1 Tax=Streptomyces sp. Z26 TaxID=2500177 RepID=UPI000EF16C76|nr:hypothetical protein [Streptomyces sp. Z26]RLL69091.1 hypothetical protein D7M15_22225 [Streptomyces sp. Z26]
MQPKQLKISSQRWMSGALAAFSQGSESYDFAVHHAGVAAEHLLKAYLASLHPALIVEGKDFNSLLHATGHGTLASLDLSRAKTIGVVEAHARVHGLLRKQMPIDAKTFLPVAVARNGVAHLGIHDVAEVQTVFTTCLRVIDPLLTELQIDPKTYWGGYGQLHEILIAKHVEEARIALASKFAKAQAVFEQRYAHLAPHEREAVLATITQPQPSPNHGEHVEEALCPACGSRGDLIGETHALPPDEGVYFAPYAFTCSACGLDLDGDEELGGLADEVPIDMTLDEYYSDWEPDEDMYRGR